MKHTEMDRILEDWSSKKDTFLIIHDFLQKVSGDGVNLCNFKKDTSINGGQYLPIMTRYNDLVMKYLGVDTDKLEEARSELLRSIQ